MASAKGSVSVIPYSQPTVVDHTFCRPLDRCDHAAGSDTTQDDLSAAHVKHTLRDVHDSDGSPSRYDGHRWGKGVRLNYFLGTSGVSSMNGWASP